MIVSIANVLKITQKQTRAMIEALSPREVRILSLRFPSTLEEVGKEFGVTRERIRQIETKALWKIKKGSNETN